MHIDQAHKEAVAFADEMNGVNWGGFDLELKARAIDYAKKSWLDNSAQIKAAVYGNRFDYFFPAIYEVYPHTNEFSEAGLHDTEARVAISDYFLAMVERS